MKGEVRGQLRMRDHNPRSPPTMNISALVNPTPEAPRRSPSNARSVTAPSPALSESKLPTPPLSTHKPMSNKRKRGDPRPIWAIREGEKYFGPPVQPKRVPPTSQPAPSPRPQHQPPPRAHANGPAAPPHASASISGQLFGPERPITDDAVVYDEMTRHVCDFIWKNIADDNRLHDAVKQAPGSQVEIEARWGQVLQRDSSMRFQGAHTTECVLRSGVAEFTKFESTMSLEQHKKMNNFLNSHVQRTRAPEANRPPINYEHTKEVDMFYELDRAAFDRLPPPVRESITSRTAHPRLRVSYRQGADGKPTGEPVRQLIKVRLDNLEISSPLTEWDYRIGINLEVNYPYPIEGLNLVVEKGKTPDTMQRKKDRVSYSWMSSYQIDLTQVRQGQALNHELELELDSERVVTEIRNIKSGEPSGFEALIAGMMNNLRVLSREMTPQHP